MKSKVPAAISAYFSKQGKKGGKLSGPARMKKLTPEQRSAIARLGGLARGRGRSKQKAA